MVYSGLFLLLGSVFLLGLLAGGFSLIYFIIAGGFLIVVPGLVTVYYVLAEQIRAGQRPRFNDIPVAIRNLPVSIIIIGLVSLLIYLIWITDALIVYSVYFDFVPASLFSFNADPVLRQDSLAFILFAGILGCVLSFIIFCITVFSIPYALQKQADLVEAIGFSVNAVTRNPLLMAIWALILGGLTFLSVLVALPLLLVILPILAYANYATYQDMLRLMESE